MIIALIGSLAWAQDKPPYDHKFSLTTSPLQVLLLTLEVTGEYRAADDLGVGFITSATFLDVPVGSLGPTVRWYPVGDFDHGMQLGADLQFVGSPLAIGAGGGPFVGYKIAARFGLTFEAQGGVGVIATRADGVTEVAPLPILNLNLGWSF